MRLLPDIVCGVVSSPDDHIYGLVFDLVEEEVDSAKWNIAFCVTTPVAGGTALGGFYVGSTANGLVAYCRSTSLIKQIWMQIRHMQNFQNFSVCWILLSFVRFISKNTLSIVHQIQYLILLWTHLNDNRCTLILWQAECGSIYRAHAFTNI